MPIIDYNAEIEIYATCQRCGGELKSETSYTTRYGHGIIVEVCKDCEKEAIEEAIEK
jgi:superfamily II helicase